MRLEDKIGYRYLSTIQIWVEKLTYRMTGWLVLLGYRLMRVLAAKLCRLLGYSRYHIEILSSLPATAQPHRWFFELITNIDIKCKINYDFPC